MKDKIILKADGKPWIWSASHFDEFKNCPEKFQAKVLEKRFPYVAPDENDLTHPITYGNKAHAYVEEFLEYGVPIPEPFKYLETYCRFFLDKVDKGAKLEPEVWAGVARGWKKDVGFKTRYGSGKIDQRLWFGDTHVLITDLKTGAFKPQFAKDTQAKAYAAFSFACYPKLEVVKTRIWHFDRAEEELLKEGRPAEKVIDRTYTRDDFEAIKAEFDALYNSIYACYTHGNWRMKQSPLCAWCPVIECPNNTSKG